MPSKQNAETVWPCVHWGGFALPLNRVFLKTGEMVRRERPMGEGGSWFVFFGDGKQFMLDFAVSGF